jgi:microcystin-dependent protein
MTDPFIGEIRMFAGNFAPVGWFLCNGQTQLILQNTALFSLLGTNYGGNGTSTFGLPDLQGRFPLATGSPSGLTSYSVGDQQGEEAVMLTQQTIPAHSHSATARAANGNANSPAGASWAQAHYGKAADKMYAPGGPTTLHPMAFTALGTTGGSQPHNNLPPYLVVNFIICAQGIFPPRG